MEDTTCPYYGYELTKGTVNVPQENFYFIPEGITLPAIRTRWTKVKGSTLIKPFRMFEGNGFFSAYYPAKAYMCSHCKKIIIDFSDINSNNSK
jgi:hypothetical protein